MMYILKDKQHETLGTIHETTIDGKQWYSESDVAKLLQIPDWFNVCMNTLNSNYRKHIDYVDANGCIRSMAVIKQDGFELLVPHSPRNDIEMVREWLFPAAVIAQVESPPITLFTNQEFGSVRTMVIDDEPWFVGKDICTIFGDKNHNRSIGRVDSVDKREEYLVDTLGRKQKAIFINESGLYALLFSMQPQKANNDGVSDAYPMETQQRIDRLRRFKHWVTSEVLPSIRKHGGYIAGQEEMDSEELLAKALLFANSKKEELEKKNQKLAQQNQLLQQKVLENQHKVEFHDTVADIGEMIDMTAFAGVLSSEDIPIGRNKLFEFFRQQKILCSAEYTKNKPMQTMIDKGYMLYKERVYRGNIQFTPYITGKGQIYLTQQVLDHIDYFKPKKATPNRYLSASL